MWVYKLDSLNFKSKNFADSFLNIVCCSCLCYYYIIKVLFCQGVYKTFLVGTSRIELLTSRLSAECFNHLNYTPTWCLLTGSNRRLPTCKDGTHTGWVKQAYKFKQIRICTLYKPALQSFRIHTKHCFLTTPSFNWWSDVFIASWG